MRRRLYIILFSLLLSPLLGAQEVINNVVEVNREYEGKLPEIIKSSISTSFSDTLLRFNLNFDYSTFDRPYKDLYEFSPMRSAQIDRNGEVRYPIFYAKLGIAYPWLPQADIYIRPPVGNKFSLLFYFNHNSFWGQLPDHHKSDKMVNRAGMQGGYSWKKGELKLMLDYSNNYYSYLDNVSSHSFDDISTGIRVRSTNDVPNSFYYDIELKYKYLNDKSKYEAGAYIKQQDIEGLGDVGVVIARNHKLLLGFESVTQFSQGSISSTRGYLQLTPKYKFEKNRWRVQGGLSYAYSYQEVGAAQVSDIVKLFPDVSVSFEAARKSLWIYASVDGENKFNSYASLIKINPYLTLSTANITNTAIPIRAKLGFRGVVRDRFSYSLYGSYSQIRDMLYFSSQGEGPLQYLSSFDNQVVTASFEMTWKTKDFTGEAEFKYHYYTDSDNLYMHPSFTAKALAIYNLRKRFFFEVNCNYRSAIDAFSSESPTGKIKIPWFVDLGANITYAMNSKWSFYIEGNNLLNRKIEYIQNYLEPGINFGVGMYLKF